MSFTEESRRVRMKYENSSSLWSTFH